MYVDDIAQWVADQGVAGGNTDWPITRLGQSAVSTGSSARGVTFYPTPGNQPEPGRTGRPSFPGMQIRVRGDVADRRAAYEECAALIALLADLGPTQMGTTNIRAIRAVQSAPIGPMPDAAGRPEYTANFLVTLGR